MRGNFMSMAEKLRAVLKGKAAKAINEGSSFVSKNAESAYNKGKSTAMATAQTASKEVSGSLNRTFRQGGEVTARQVAAATTKASHVVRDASTSIASSARLTSKEATASLGRAYNQSKKTTSRASHAVRDASSDIASSAKEAAKEAADEARKEARNMVRWLWWWSLVAIGVYGVATTVPRELVRHALQPRSKEERPTEGEK